MEPMGRILIGGDIKYLFRMEEIKKETARLKGENDILKRL